MRPLRVALVTRPGSTPGERNVGWWSYPVPEFEVMHFEARKGEVISRAKFAGYALVVWEDGKSVIRWVDKGPPIAYAVCDSTLSDDHYQRRLRMAKQADVILVDFDRLERFEGLDKPVRRFSHCVNDRRFKDWGEPRSVDVSYHLREDTPERQALGDWLAALCAGRGYSLARGGREGDDYARAFNRSKVTVNLNRNPQTRSHRLLDAMGCRTCVVTDPMPEVSGEQRTPGVEYVEWPSLGDLAFILPRLLDTGAWQVHADCGHDLVEQLHTWQARATQLRATLRELGIG